MKYREMTDEQLAEQLRLLTRHAHAISEELSIRYSESFREPVKRLLARARHRARSATSKHTEMPKP